jgi:crotonobetainyl-CoA:carnitine CoA-transferase CaiB-like acyl-CoA transferase
MTTAVGTNEARVTDVLVGEQVTGHNGALPERTCLRHLALLGATVKSVASSRVPGAEAGRLIVGGDGTRTEAVITWGTGAPLGEVGVQAASGLMALHGGRFGRPRRLGVEVASGAAGILAATGVLAARLAQLRGGASRRVETSALGATLLFVAHHLAGATSGDDWAPPPPGPDPGPPFRSADGCWFELETFDTEAWRDFWQRLGLAGAALGTGWGLFFARFLTAAGSLPAGFHAAIGQRTLAEITAAASATGVSVCPIRTAEEVLGEWGGKNGGRGGRGGAPWGLRPSGTGAFAAQAPAAPPAEMPLAGLRLVEVTRRLQGPLAGLLLQMLGARVTRIEPPGGDLLRMMPPVAGDCSAAFIALNRGKESVELDVKRPTGRDELVELVAGADVFLHNMAPGKAEQLGLDSATLAACNPRLVYGHASGWGDALGPRPPLGTEYLVQAHSGLAAALNPAGDPPFPSLVTLADVAGALVSAEGLVAGLLLRERTGQGCRVGASLLSGATDLQAHILDALRDGVEAGRRRGRPQWGPLDVPLETAEGYLVVEAGDDEVLHRLGEACGIDHERLARREVEMAVVERLGGRPAAEWESLLRAAGVACAAVRLDLARLPDDPEVAPALERAGGCWVPRAPWRFS